MIIRRSPDEMAMKETESIRNELLPVRLTSAYQPDFKPVHYLQAADGTVMSMGIRKDWAEYIVKWVNRGSELINLPRTHLGKVIMTITYPGAPLNEYAAKQVVKSHLGRLTLALSVEFVKAKDKAVAILKLDKDRTKKRNMKGSVHLVGVFVTTYDDRAHLSEYLVTLEKMLYEVHIFNPNCHNIVKSYAGSEIIYSDNKDEWRTTAYIREWDK